MWLPANNHEVDTLNNYILNTIGISCNLKIECKLYDNCL